MSTKRGVPKSEDRTTISISRSEYDKLVEAKRKLEGDPEYTWLAAAGLGAFIGFILGVALNSPEIRTRLSPSYFKCSCGQLIDLTGSPRAFSCPNCGTSYIQQKPELRPKHVRG